MTYDILNPETWNVITDDTPLVYNDVTLLSQETGEPIKAVDFIKFLGAIQNITKEDSVNLSAIKKLLQRMVDAQIGKSN